MTQSDRTGETIGSLALSHAGGQDPPETVSIGDARLAAVGVFLQERFPNARCSLLQRVEDDVARHVWVGNLSKRYVARVEELLAQGRADPFRTALDGRSGVTIEDVALLGEEDSALRDAARDAGIRTLWTVPLRFRDGSAAGVLAIHHRERVVFDERSSGLVQTAASLAELALVNKVEASVLHEREQRARAMDSFRSSVMGLIEMALAEGSPSDFDQRLIDEAVRVIPGAETGAVLRRVSDDAYRYTATHGFDLERLRTVRMPPHAVSFGYLDDSPRPRVIPNPTVPADMDPMDAMTLEEEAGWRRITSVLNVPVVVGGERTAYMTLDSYADEVPFDDEAIEMARVFAGQAASLMQRFQLEASLKRMAYEDSLTGLPNRTSFKTTLQNRLDAGRTYAGHAVLFVDLDNLKPINDSIGHLAGDAVLTEVAARLKQSVKMEDGVIARLGGDEFTILLSGPNIGDDAAETAQRVIFELRKPIKYHDYDVVVGASIGISIAPDDGNTVTDLLRHADIAMYQAKQTGKGHYRFFLDEMEAGARERVLLETAMREGLARDEFEVHFQPRVRMRDGRIASAEALVRWRHPERGMVSPGQFVPLAEATNLIHQLGRKVLEMACFQAADWPAHDGDVAPTVSVNLSRHQLQRQDIVDEIAFVLQASNLPPERLEVEVVETGAMSDVNETSLILSRIRDLGVRVALDDFGTGHSSLGWLQQLPVDVLKLDRTFIARIADTPSAASNGKDDLAILRAILSLGHALDLTVVAEGIETVQQFQLLRGLGCDEAQGWLFAKPLPHQELLAHLERGSFDLPQAPLDDATHETLGATLDDAFDETL